MSTMNDDSHASLRRGVYLLLITIGLGAVLGRILVVDAVDRTALQDDRIKRKLNPVKEDLKKRGVEGREMEVALEQEKSRLQSVDGMRRPFLSANDRSRWCTVRALVDPEMRVEGAPYSIDKVIQQPNWDTIDMVKHDGHLYSSKPPLLPTLMAAECWAIQGLTGMSLATHPFEVGRFMVATINGGCLLAMFLAMAWLVERLGTSDWGRLFVMAAAVFGTFLTTFAIVINNHLVAAACAAVLLALLVRIWMDGERRPWVFVLAGLVSALLASNELPAAALSAAVSLALLWKAPRQTLLAYVPAALVVTAAFFGTNWIAHGSLKPAYMHRGGVDNWYDYSYERGGRVIDSYWRNPSGIDRGEPRTARYVMHALVGHHGIFSLTPIWLLSICGTLLWLRKSPDRQRRELAVLVGTVSLVCLAFYLGSSSVDRNYGGTCSAFRWVFWMAPMWLVVMLPAADAVSGRRWARAVALILLAASILSTTYPTWNPWTHPWLMDFMTYQGWTP